MTIKPIKEKPRGWANLQHQIREVRFESFKQGKLTERNRVLKLIDGKLKLALNRLEYCKKHSKEHSKEDGDYYDHESFRALSVCNELEKLKKEIEGK